MVSNDSDAMRCALLSTALSWTCPPAGVRQCVFVCFWGRGGHILSKLSLLLMVSPRLPTPAFMQLLKYVMKLFMGEICGITNLLCMTSVFHVSGGGIQASPRGLWESRGGREPVGWRAATR